MVRVATQLNGPRQHRPQQRNGVSIGRREARAAPIDGRAQCEAFALLLPERRHLIKTSGDQDRCHPREEEGSTNGLRVRSRRALLARRHEVRVTIDEAGQEREVSSPQLKRIPWDVDVAGA